jgi:hypothetical protein
MTSSTCQVNVAIEKLMELLLKRVLSARSETWLTSLKMFLVFFFSNIKESDLAVPNRNVTGHSIDEMEFTKESSIKVCLMIDVLLHLLGTLQYAEDPLGQIVSKQPALSSTSHDP